MGEDEEEDWVLYEAEDDNVSKPGAKTLRQRFVDWYTELGYYAGEKERARRNGDKPRRLPVDHLVEYAIGHGISDSPPAEILSEHENAWMMANDPYHANYSVGSNGWTNAR